MPITRVSGRTDRYTDGDMRMLLENAARRLLDAEGERRVAAQRFEVLLASCHRHGQDALAAEAVKNLDDRRLH
jgi:hypothetical protein